MTDNNLSPIAARRAMAEYFQHPSVRAQYESILLQSAIPLEKFAAAVCVEAMREPKLALAITQSAETLVEALTVCAHYDLTPGAKLGQFYLIPRWNGRARRTEVTFIVGYKGYLQVALRNPRVHLVEAHVAYTGEPFSYSPADSRVRHEWSSDPNVRTELLSDIQSAYAVCRLTTPDGQQVDATPLITVLSGKAISSIRDRSEGWKAFQAGRISSTPWASDPEPMARKSAIRRLFNSGSVPLDSGASHGMPELMAREALEDTVVEADSPTVPAGRGLAGMAAALDTSIVPMTPDDARAHLGKLRTEGLLPDDIHPDMLSDEDAINCAQGLG